MDANNLANHIVSLITCGNLLTPMKEINKGELPDTLDLSIPQIVCEPIIRLVDKNWVRFLAKFFGYEATLRKRVDPEGMKVKTCKEFVASRFEHCYEKNWRNAADSGTSWAVTKGKEHQDCELHEACLFVAVGRSWTLWHVDFDPATPSVTTVISGWELWLVSTQTEFVRELCRDSGRLMDLLKLRECGGGRLKHVHWAIQKTGDSLVLPWGLAHCVLTMSDRMGTATTSMMSYVINDKEAVRLAREAWINSQLADNSREVPIRSIE